MLGNLIDLSGAASAGVEGSDGRARPRRQQAMPDAQASHSILRASHLLTAAGIHH